MKDHLKKDILYLLASDEVSPNRSFSAPALLSLVSVVLLVRNAHI